MYLVVLNASLSNSTTVYIVKFRLLNRKPFEFSIIDTLNVLWVSEVLHSTVQTSHKLSPRVHFLARVTLPLNFLNRVFNLLYQASAEGSLNGKV